MPRNTLFAINICKQGIFVGSFPYLRRGKKVSSSIFTCLPLVYHRIFAT